ncbi:MAG: hypothetical protein ACO2ON_01590, partial [Candidatus Nanopusillus sp.]
MNTNNPIKQNFSQFFLALLIMVALLSIAYYTGLYFITIFGVLALLFSLLYFNQNQNKNR